MRMRPQGHDLIHLLLLQFKLEDYPSVYSIQMRNMGSRFEAFYSEGKANLGDLWEEAVRVLFLRTRFLDLFG